MEWEDIVTQMITGTAGLVAVIIFIGIIVIGYVLYQRSLGRYKHFKCIIWQKDGFGQLTQKYDKAGIFVDPDTKNKRLFLQKANVGLNPDNIPFIPAGKTRIIFLLQTGLKNFKYIRPVIEDKYINLTVGEEDVNWAINAYDKSKKLFQQSWIMQYMPFIILAFVCMIILILFMYLFKQFGTIKELIIEIQTLARLVAAAKSGTTIL